MGVEPIIGDERKVIMTNVTVRFGQVACDDSV